ncbi:sulfurtransferase TusA [Vibrio barjaei]|uniref:sulfurtransferase TusA n=1 Tax=Vibrio barjaei TaxID=1676683 RepID=UPI0022839D0C|nr:sulfurtransferase TusA [Vibrio barjaei]MCY9872344.1 sulfurtransferase TusA [Vibrio barjaei]
MKTLDLKGLKCPEPVMMVRKHFRKMNNGDRVKILATDPSTQRDLPSFCRHMDHTLVDSSEQNGLFTFEIQKGKS